MILRSLTLENIRSYKHEQPIQFPLGTILFEGDIGCGKSTILYAIEFALFGLGSTGSSFLLRNGAREGSVTLQFEVNETAYEVHRHLVKKGKTVNQEDCYLTGPEGKSILSTTELKEKVLQVLNFNEPSNPRAQSVIYRYAIFTPQEEMKEVITKEPDDRLQTLRKAFRIEDYKIAADNSAKLTTKLQEKISKLEGATQDIDSIKTKIKDENALIEKLNSEITPLRTKETELNTQITQKDDQIKQLQTEREKIKQAEGTLPILQNQLEENTKQLKEIITQNTKLRKQIDEEIQPKINKFQIVKKPSDKTTEELKQEQELLRTQIQDKQKLKGRFDERIGNFASITETKTCPICERPADPDEFKNRSKHLEDERKNLDQQIEHDTGALKHIETTIEELGMYTDAQNQLRLLIPQSNEINARIKNNEEKITQLNERIEELKNKLDAAKKEIEPLQNVLTSLDKVGKERELLNAELISIGKVIAAKGATIEASRKNLTQLQNQLFQKEKELQTLAKLRDHKLWLNEYFAPTIENIEKHVMTSLNQRFNDQFQKWFQILIDDPDMQVRVNEDFSPLIEHEGYEQEFIGLSGGEKTSVALAYRLALNTIVQEVAITGGSNLLILDEPTDGFSREQVLKIRDILSEIRCPQVIMVSHEKELEGFADHVFRVRKEDGTSIISMQA
ncbi:MAG: SMC family ATPase [Candidatus Bathyarchaeia archaeon]|jgi:exonuclease SbcC